MGILIGLLLGLLIGGGFAFHIHKNSKNLAEIAYQRGQKDIKEAFLEGQQAALDQFDFRVVPVCHTKKIGLLFMETHDVRVGYKFQLYISGMPSFATAEEIVQSVQMKTIRREELAKLTQDIVRTALAVKTGGVSLSLLPPLVHYDG